ncbi:hypothetical protein Lal_00043043 [Lupinus albus]|nr:hypothetical protein Lal_00043043 [Lupinus albus]
MASSSKRPRTSKSKQGESSSKSNPLYLTRLLAHDTQRKVFEEIFHGRAIFTPKYANNIYPEIVRKRKGGNRKINWAKMIMQQMWHVRGSQSPLPYAIYITKILEHFGVSLDGETKVSLNIRKSKIDIEIVHKMGFVLDPVTRRTYKYRTDCQTAPSDQPEPTAPDQPEFQAPSTSYAAMPSNQMIMDELDSLRGYITTRMDAIDTQNQQIHYELHRLSSRLSIKDIDEDSSEPES